MRKPLEQTVLRHIRNQRMIPAGARVALAVSGGADSVALLCILNAIHKELGVTLCVAHFNHLLRGPESEEDVRFVAELARTHQLDLFVERADVAHEAQRKGWNLEDAARRLRYAFFRSLVDEGRATHVAVAHTEDDQAETVLAHLIRGTGPTGIAAIHPVAGVVVRPLLEFRRGDLRDYLKALGQAWREDSTNADPARLRSRIRHQLVPQIEKSFSNRIVEHLCAVARLSLEEQAFWGALVEDRYRALVREVENSRGPKYLGISTTDLLNPLRAIVSVSNLPVGDLEGQPTEWRPLTERLIRRVYEQLRGTRCALTLVHVDQVIQLAAKSTSGKWLQLPGGIRVERKRDALLFSLDAAATKERREAGDSAQMPVKQRRRPQAARRRVRADKHR